MKIKFQRFEATRTNPNPNGKTYPIIRVYGEALEGKLTGQEYSAHFFTSEKDMKSQVENLSPGDIVNISFKKNKGFYNPVKFEKIENDTSVVSQTATTAPIKQAVPVDMKAVNRRDNMKIALSVLGPKAAKKDTFDYMAQAGAIADLIQDYIDKKGAFQFDGNTSDGIPDMIKEEEKNEKEEKEELLDVDID